MSNDKIPVSRVSNKKPKRKLKKHIKFILFGLLAVLIAALSYGTYIYFKADLAMNRAYEEDERESGKSDLRDDYVDPKFDNVSILIMGIDQSEKREMRYGDKSRTDALILATLNRDDKSIKLLSIPRDSYVYIPEVGYYDKINHAHAFGSTKATISAVENLLEIPVDYYVKLNFHAFVDVIDAIGGVEVDVPYEFKESDSNDKQESIHLYPGRQVLDGEEALAFARTRYKDNDVERGKRQLEVIDSVVNKATNLSSLFKYDDIIEAVGNNMATNMTFTEMKSFFYYATEGSNLDVEQFTLAGEDYQPEGTYYYQVDEVALIDTINTLKNHLEITTIDDQESEQDVDYAEEYQETEPEADWEN